MKMNIVLKIIQQKPTWRPEKIIARCVTRLNVGALVLMLIALHFLFNLYPLTVTERLLEPSKTTHQETCYFPWKTIRYLFTPCKRDHPSLGFDNRIILVMKPFYCP